jgi:hypothetical protein
MFRTVPVSIIRSYSRYTQQWYMSYRFVDSFRAGSGWNCSSILILLLESCLKICVTYTIAECTVNNSWWWTQELSETCTVSFQNKFEKLVHLVGFIIRKFVMMHGHRNVKKMPANSFRGTAQHCIYLRHLDFYKWRHSNPLVYSAQIQN